LKHRSNPPEPFDSNSESSLCDGGVAPFFFPDPNRERLLFFMKLRVVSPLETIVKYALTELFGIAFFLLVLRNLSPYQYFSVMQTLQYGLLIVVVFFLLLPVFVELFGFGAARLVLSGRGVIYKTRGMKYKLNWDEVERVILSPDLYAQVTKRSYIVFYADETPALVRNRSEFHPRAIGLQYRKGLPKVIAQYCDLEIENLNRIEKKR
jgi:hypothetical protein